MKKLVSILLCITILISNNHIAMAGSVKVEDEAEYYSVNVEYTDALGEIEQLSVMIQNNNVYVNVCDVARGLGYSCGYNDEYCTIENRNNDSLPYTMATFYFDSTQVVYQLGTSICTNYEAPFISIKDEDTVWVPFEYSIYLLKSSMLIVDDCIVITMPEKTIIDYIYEIQKNTHLYYSFTYEDDFGYTDTDVAILSGSNHVVNIFNGLLDFDGDAWGQLFDLISLDSASFDSKYGQEFTTLFCTQSDEELAAIIDKVEKFQDIFLEDGKLYSYLELYSDGLTDSLMSSVSDLTNNLSSANPSTARTSAIFTKISNTLDDKELFSETGGMVMDIQEGLSDSLSVVDTLLQVAEVVEYANEFSNRDTYAVSTLAYCIENSKSAYNVSEAMMISIEENIELLESSLLEYTAINFIKDNLDEWIKDAIPMKEVLGTSAAMSLIAWNLASSFIPFVSDGLSSANQFELSLYAMVMQENAYVNKVNANSETFYSDTVMVENLYEATLYNYMYLKCCLITREAALATLVSKRESVLEQIQPLIDEQNAINEEIAEILAEFKDANETNEGMVYGFLLDDNVEYLENYDDTLLIEFCIGENLTELDGIVDLTGRWSLDYDLTYEYTGNTLVGLFGPAYSNYGSEMNINSDGNFDYYIGAGNGGEGTYIIKENELEYTITIYEEGYTEMGTLTVLEIEGLVYLCMNLDYVGDVYWSNQEESNQEDNITFETFYNNETFMEYAVIQDLNAEGDLIWEITTGECIVTELDGNYEIGQFEDLYIYAAEYKVIAVEVATGEKVWENSEFYGRSCGVCAIDEDGNIYLAGYYGPEFFALDVDGNTLGSIDVLDERYMWPQRIEIDGDIATVYMAGTAEGDYYDESFLGVQIDLNTMKVI